MAKIVIDGSLGRMEKNYPIRYTEDAIEIESQARREYALRVYPINSIDCPLPRIGNINIIRDLDEPRPR
jgi:hypothetical protein